MNSNTGRSHIVSEPIRDYHHQQQQAPLGHFGCVLLSEKKPSYRHLTPLRYSVKLEIDENHTILVAGKKLSSAKAASLTSNK